MKSIHIALFIFISGIFSQSAFAAKEADTEPDSLINTVAPDFELKDLSGKSVRLSDLRGKVIVLDFWATWCEPCKQSFPAVQLAVNHYSKDKDVVFLFIDTKERTKDYPSRIEKFLTEKKYSFNVLLDQTGADGTQSKVFKGYGFRGIPARVIIDQSGMIRVRRLGYDPEQTDLSASNALVAEIERVKKL